MEQMKKDVIIGLVNELSCIDDVRIARIRTTSEDRVAIEIMAYPWISLETSDDYNWLNDTEDEASEIIEDIMGDRHL